jgi:sterol desaturase/sphingolipid hydroxylase (fatty acid hydroxylase superfamily)
MGFAGLEGGKIFGSPQPGAWVDTAKPAGATSLLAWYGCAGWWKPFLTQEAFFMSPNLPWFVIALATYLLFPYDLDAARRGWAAAWVLHRVYINVGLVLLYAGGWYLPLYHLGWASRKFNPSQRRPSRGRLLHNVWYTALGAAQWGLWEAGFMRLWATGKLPFVSDADVFATPRSAAIAALWTLAIPAWRELHFYWAHRLLHVRALYRFVHALHHRNVDPEPFSGLCMHPVEHLYYFATVAPSLVLPLAAGMSPFHLLWNGLHAAISPAAGHSGWEDHWSSDVHHYLHHRYFECNYGGGGIPLDLWFRTLRVSILKGGNAAIGAGGKGGSTYAGGAGTADPDSAYAEAKAKAKAKAQAVGCGQSSLELANALPKRADGEFLALVSAIALVLFMALTQRQAGAGTVAALHEAAPLAVPLLVAAGPVLAAALLNAAHGDRFSLIWPFRKEPLLQFGGHLAVGVLFTVVPVTWFVYLLLL